MIALLCFFLTLLTSPFKSKSRLEAENVALRHQVIVLQRRVSGRVQLTNGDRLFLVMLYRWFPSVLKAITIIRPETLVRWHRAGFRRYWRWKSGSLGGRPKIDAELRALIRRMSAENPLWGAPRIHGELLKLGIEVAQSSVAKYMLKRCGPPSQRWRTFLHNHAPAIGAMDLLVLAGAGLSIPAGLVNWKELMRSIAAEIGLDVEKESDLIAIAQYHLNERGGRQRLHQILVNEFSDRAKVSENLRILARLPIETFWTTNYDHSIENALREGGKRIDVKVTPENLATTLPRRDAVVFKMHGDVSDPSNAVVTKDDYESYAVSRRGQLFSTALRGDLVSKTFLFIGFSFSDPNVDYLLGRIRVLLEGSRREHYCLMRSVQRQDFGKPRDFQYARTKQELQIKDLRRYGIMTVLLDTFGHYTETLKHLDRRYRARQIFISGSATTYAPWTENEAHRFLSLLGRRLAENGMSVVTGFGLGIGSYVINGVLDGLEREGTRNLSERLTLRPFPHAIADPEKRRSRWASYRTDMISNAGVAVFVFGNTGDRSGRIVPADGMIEEFKIAVAAGLLIVPVGSTGHVAETIHNKVSEDFQKYFQEVRGLRTTLAALGKKGTPTEMVERVIKFIALATQKPKKRTDG
jgi:hypothetical protein